jgi:DNA-3-methyladenine glycosylase II
VPDVDLASSPPQIPFQETVHLSNPAKGAFPKSTKGRRSYLLILPLTLNPVPPYDFALSTSLFVNGDPQVRRAENGTFWQVIRVEGEPVLVRARSTGSVEEPKITLEAMGRSDLSRDQQKKAGEAVSWILALSDDLKKFHEAISSDARMTWLAHSLPGLKSYSNATAFEALVATITEQQISIQVARALESRLVKLLGEPLEAGGAAFFAFPTPERLARATEENYRACGLSTRKGEYIRNAARMVVQGDLDLEQYRAVPDSSRIVEELSRIRGIGAWTAEFVLLRGLHRLDAIPADDLGVRRAMARYYCPGRTITGEDVRERAEQWGAWKGLAAFYLLVGERHGITFPNARVAGFEEES